MEYLPGVMDHAVGAPVLRTITGPNVPEQGHQGLHAGRPPGLYVALGITYI